MTVTWTQYLIARYWYGIQVEKGGSVSAAYASISYGNPGLTLVGGSANLDHTTFSHNNRGLDLSGSAAATINNASFTNNSTGLAVEGNASGAVALHSCAFTNNSGNAIELYNPSVPLTGGGDSFSGNGFNGSEAFGSGSIGGSIITTPITWAPDTTGSVQLRGIITVAAGVTLSLAAGEAVAGIPEASSGGLPALLDIQGTLAMSGTATSPITLTSASTSPAVGDWYGIQVEKGGSVSASYTTISYAATGLAVDGGSATIDHASISAANDAIWAAANANVSILNSTIPHVPDLEFGVHVDANANVTILNSTIIIDGVGGIGVAVYGSASVSIHNSAITDVNHSSFDGILNCAGCTPVQAQNNY